MKIDFHSHLFPPEYFRALERHGLVFGLGGDRFALFDRLYDIDVHRRDMDEYGVDVQVLSLGPPGVDLDGASPEVTVELARIANDALAEVVTRRPCEFAALAVLPLRDPEAAVREFLRAVTDLPLQGAIIFSNVDGRPLDAPEFAPLFALAAEREVPLFLHPTLARAREGLSDYGLMISVGLLFDSTLAVARLVFAGLFERLPTLRLVLAHLGSTLPYIEARLDIESQQLAEFVPGFRLPIPKPPSTYLRQVYMDTVSHHGPAYYCALATVGPERIVLGSDYPYSLWRRTVTAIEDLAIPAADKEKIYAENVRRLVHIPAS